MPRPRRAPSGISGGPLSENDLPWIVQRYSHRQALSTVDSAVLFCSTMRASGLFLGLLTLIEAGKMGAGDWLQFRGPAGMGIADTTSPPTDFAGGKNLIWKTPLPPGHSSPIL